MQSKNSLAKTGEKNPMWGVIKKEVPGYSALHQWVKLRLDRPSSCQHCDANVPVQLANKSQLYKRDLSDWLWLCKQCHFEYDRHIHDKNLAYGRALKKGVPLTEEHKSKLSNAHMGQIAWNKSVPVQKPCEHCGVVISFIRWERRRFCSKSCATTFNRRVAKERVVS